MKKSKLFVVAAFIMATVSAFAFKPLTNGYTGSSPSPCNPANVDLDCSTTHTGAICTDLHFQPDCSDLLRKTNP